MRRFDGTSQPAAGNMGVDLCRRNVGVAQQCLHAPQVRAAFDEMRRERMS
jgi:hypothetical protein